MKSKIISILALLLTVTQGAWAQTNNYEPLGSFWSSQGSADWLSFTPINGAIFIAGWAADQDYPGQSTHVDWYVWNNYSDAQTPNWNSHVNHGGIDPDIYADYSSLIGEWCKGNIVFNRYIRMDQGTYYFRAWSIDYTSAGVRAQYPKNHEMGNSYSGNIVNTVIVYAPYTVTLDRQSGTGGSASVSNVCTGFDMPSITVPTREGYTFGGYYSETGGNGTKYYNADGTSARYWNQASESATATLYAKWTPIASYNVTANSASEAYWATFYSNAGNYQAAEGTQVFTVSLAGTGITMHEVSDRIAKSGQGVVLKKTTTGNFTMTLTETAPAGDFSGNSLTGTMTVINTTGANDYYVLGGKSGAGFYKLSNTSGTIGANKAYLTYSGGGVAAARGFFLFDETTGIEMPTAEDGNADAVVYDLQGRRVLNPTKGLYIVNGKKVFINK